MGSGGRGVRQQGALLGEVGYAEGKGKEGGSTVRGEVVRGG